jgi:hypothetical protein
MRNKKGYYFTTDALIALIIIVGVVIFLRPSVNLVMHSPSVHEDLLNSLSVIEIGDLNNTYVKQLIANGTITNLNQSVLEQLGEFYAISSPEATNIAQEIIGDLDLKDNIGVYFNNEMIFQSDNNSYDDAEDIWTSRQIISGIQQGDSVKGFSSRAFLSSSNKINYYYFGGYVGDGNISMQIGKDITEASIEAVFSSPFKIYINGFDAGEYTPQFDIPYNINLNSHSDKFNSGENLIEFESMNSSGLSISGGFIRTINNETTIFDTERKHNLAGIKGLINIYDSFYIPGNLSEMEIFLNYNSSYDIFVTIGNKTIYKNNSGGLNKEITLTNDEISSIIDYSEFDRGTIPFRVALENVSYLSGERKDVDVISVTDLSGSMLDCAELSNPYMCNYNCFIGGSKSCQVSSPDLCTGNVCGGTCWFPNSHSLDCEKDLMDLAKEANELFIGSVLNESHTRVGLVGYAGSATDSNFHQLSQDEESLDNKVGSWIASGSTCICCGINKAVTELITNSDEDKFRSIIVMSDGIANVQCSQQGTGSSSGDAIKAACDAYQDHGINVYSIGFGNEADETTLQEIASCGEGSYYQSNIDDLLQIYEEIAREVIEASYLEQTIISEGIYSIIYPDSYIKLDYESEINHGLIIKSETTNFGNDISQGELFIPEDATVQEVVALSYSGSKWTDNVEIYNNETEIWESVFNLSHYNLPYVQLGDPFVVNLPVDKIKTGNNLVRVSTGLSSTNSTGGSIYNKIIYTLIKEMSSYSPIVSSANGCIWTIEFEDGTNNTLTIPSEYNGTSNCYYTSDIISYNENDAINLAIFKILTELDLNLNNRVETKFDEQDLSLDSSEVNGIPFTWNTEVQIRIWR